MEIIEFNKAFDSNELKSIIDKAMLVYAPVSVKTRWRDLCSMILMNQNPTLAQKIKMWDTLMVAGFIDATQDLVNFTNKIFNCPDIDVIRNIVYVEDAWVKWAKTTLLLSKDVASKRDSESILDAMLKIVDNGSPIGSQVRAIINDHPQIDAKYKRLDAAIEKVLYNNGKLVSCNYTIAPDGVNATVGGRRVICGAGNGYYLDAKGALRVSPKWRLVFLPDGNFAVQDSSHASVITGDLGTIAGFCGANFGIDIVKVLRDNNIAVNLTNNTSVTNTQVNEKIANLLEARQEAVAVLEEIAACVKTTAGNYEKELEVAESVVKKRVNAIDVLLYHYDVDPETGCPNHPENNNPADPDGSVNPGSTIVVNEDIQPLFDAVGTLDKEEAWVYDLINQLASDTLEPKEKGSDTWIAKGTFKGHSVETIPEMICGVNQIVEVKETSKTELKCECMRVKGDVDETYKEWSFTIDKFTGEYTITLEDNKDEYTSIFDIYPNAKEFAEENATIIKGFLKAVKDVVLGGESDNNEGDDKEKEVNEGASLSIGDVKEEGKGFVIEVSASGLKKLNAIISKCRPSNKSVAEYNGSLAKPLITVINSDIKRSTPVATITFNADDKATITVPESDSVKGKKLGDLFNV